MRHHGQSDRYLLASHPMAETLPRAEDGSLVVDARLRVADGLYAAGDIARFPLRGIGAPIRVEHWRVAESTGAWRRSTCSAAA